MNQTIKKQVQPDIEKLRFNALYPIYKLIQLDLNKCRGSTSIVDNQNIKLFEAGRIF